MARIPSDPIVFFFQLHTFLFFFVINFKLGFDNITIPKIEVETPGAPRNTFQTFWQKSDVDLSRGMDFAPRGPVLARLTHLQHTAFNYK